MEWREKFKYFQGMDEQGTGSVATLGRLRLLG